MKEILNDPNTHIMAKDYYIDNLNNMGIAYALQSKVTEDYFLLLLKYKVDEKIFNALFPWDANNSNNVAKDIIFQIMQKPTVKARYQLYGPVTQEFLIYSKKINYRNL